MTKASTSKRKVVFQPQLYGSVYGTKRTPLVISLYKITGKYLPWVSYTARTSRESSPSSGAAVYTWTSTFHHHGSCLHRAPTLGSGSLATFFASSLGSLGPLLLICESTWEASLGSELRWMWHRSAAYRMEEVAPPLHRQPLDVAVVWCTQPTAALMVFWSRRWKIPVDDAGGFCWWAKRGNNVCLPVLSTSPSIKGPWAEVVLELATAGRERRFVWSTRMAGSRAWRFSPHSFPHQDQGFLLSLAQWPPTWTKGFSKRWFPPAPVKLSGLLQNQQDWRPGQCPLPATARQIWLSGSPRLETHLLDYRACPLHLTCPAPLLPRSMWCQVSTIIYNLHHQNLLGNYAIRPVHPSKNPQLNWLVKSTSWNLSIFCARPVSFELWPQAIRDKPLLAMKMAIWLQWSGWPINLWLQEAHINYGETMGYIANNIWYQHVCFWAKTIRPNFIAFNAGNLNQ